MKTFFNAFLWLILVSFIASSCNKEEGGVEITPHSTVDHPRILLLEGEEEQIHELIASDDTWKKVHETILDRSTELLSEPVLKRVIVGRNILGTSREALQRLFYLAYSYRMTGENHFMVRARDELVAVCKFNDWNPSHFLDVAEMTLGVAIAYDWLYEDLSELEKIFVKRAIMNKGLQPSQDSQFNWFLNSSMNWNPVCNAGMVYGALAVQEDYPDVAKEIIDRAFESLPTAMEAYQPDGAHPEGYTYWDYGTTFNNLILTAIEKMQIDDRGLVSNPGYLETGHFLKHMVTPTGGSFNWGDCSEEANLTPAMFWFGDFTKDPSILWSEKKFLESDDFSKIKEIRILPALMIWAKNIPLSTISEPKEKFWMGQGANPVAMMRNSWTDPNAMYLGFKAGTPRYVHAHMDVGSFVMEAEGVRWAADLGKVVYEDLQALGMYIFGSNQDAERWTIFRMSTYAHNVLIIDNMQQRVDGYAKIDKYSDKENFMYSVSNISEVYDGQLKKANRGVGIVDGKYTIIRDEVETLNKATKVRWNMVTFSEVDLGEKEATLTDEGKKLILKVQGPDNVEMLIWSTAPTNNYDPENPGTVMVGFECEVPANTTEEFEVLLIPEGSVGDATFLDKPLNEW